MCKLKAENKYGVTSHTAAVWLVSKLATRPPCG